MIHPSSPRSRSSDAGFRSSQTKNQALAWFLLAFASLISLAGAASEKPNILWIYIEDMSPWISCYGSEVNAGKTPNIDSLAKQGVRFERTFVTAPVCSPCRSAVITGAYQTSTGTHNHRSSRSKLAPIHLPGGVTTLPALFQAQGYQCFNAGKEDYNFVHDRNQIYAPELKKGQSKLAAWRALKGDQAWFGQIQLSGGKHDARRCEDRVDPSSVTPPPYFPDNELFRKWHAWHFDTVRITDREVGEIMANLKQDGLLENTIVLLFSDHGNNHSVRAKQFCTESGTHVPLIIAGPDQRLKPGTSRKDLTSLLDIGATSLALAGIDIPAYFDSRDLFAQDFKPRDFVISARDRCDYTIDKIRSVRTDRFRYIKNFLTDRPLLQPQYRDNEDYVKFLRAGHEAGSLPELTEKIFFGPRPAEELYEIGKDPHEIHNLVKDPEYAGVLREHRKILDGWIQKTGDKGMEPESDAGLRATLELWKKRCVNPEYERVK